MDKVQCIIDLYNKYGACDYIGENISQIEHAIQSAVYAESLLTIGYKNKKLKQIIPDLDMHDTSSTSGELNNNIDDSIKNSIIVGALLHDIGHLLYFDDKNILLMNRLGVKNHEEAGAVYLRKAGFNDLVIYLVNSHVRCKRYLVAKYPKYRELLSEASLQTLEHQGGPMSLREIQRFESEPYFKYALLVRFADEYAKAENTSSQGIEYYRECIFRCIV
jgi:2-amino-1-hydroxyethylphosphonate dioxygenase (glycine-forming)